MPLFMVIERFGAGSLDRVGERFRTQGRLLPPGVEYLDSWMTPDGQCCYQLMRAPARADLDGWIERWSDLVSFEVAEVVSSQAYWSSR